MSLADRLKRLDGHSSVSNEFRVHTFSGALLSLSTLAAIGYLVWSEYRFNFRVDIVEKVHVNATSPTGLDVEFDLTLWSVPCAIVAIDSNDPTGPHGTTPIAASRSTAPHLET